MKTYTLNDELNLPIPIDEAWDFFSNPNNLSRIMPDSMDFKVVKGASLPIYNGQFIEYTVTPLPFFKTKWVSEMKNIKKPNYFEDTQVKGPYKHWLHQHILEPTADGTKVVDLVEYQVPLGILGRLLHPIIVKPKLKKIFNYRKKHIQQLFN